MKSTGKGDFTGALFFYDSTRSKSRIRQFDNSANIGLLSTFHPPLSDFAQHLTVVCLSGMTRADDSCLSFGYCLVVA